jgi:hypothetical protein
MSAHLRTQVGVHLSKDLMAIAGYSLKANITTLGPLVLPVSEQLVFLANLFARKARPRLPMPRNRLAITATPSPCCFSASRRSHPPRLV